MSAVLRSIGFQFLSGVPGFAAGLFGAGALPSASWV